MERVTGGPWTEFECRSSPLQLREYALREFWRILVDDRPFCRDARFKHANVQSEAFFSHAVTVMDKICGLEDDEKRVGSKFTACKWIHTKEVLTGGQMATTEMELCVSWVCAGTFDDHEWVSESTIAQQEEEVKGQELDYETCVPCVVQWCMLWFLAPTRLNQTLESQGIKIAKYHEAVNMGVAYAISRPFGEETPGRACWRPWLGFCTKHTGSGE